MVCIHSSIVFKKRFLEIFEPIESVLHRHSVEVAPGIFSNEISSLRGLKSVSVKRYQIQLVSRIQSSLIKLLKFS